VTKKWKEILWAEPLEPPKLTPEEAFEAGRKGDLSGYDAAARKCARLLYEAAQQNCIIGYILGLMSKISGEVGRQLQKGSTPYHQIWQSWFLDMNSFLTYALEKETPEIKKAIEDVNPTAFMWGWAVQATIEALKEDEYYDELLMWPKRGHLVKEGTCPRCHIPIQKSWKYDEGEG
jgi:hypothetical protein